MLKSTARLPTVLRTLQPPLRTRRTIMHLRTTQRIELPPTADMHVHMRQGDLMKLVAPTVAQGGVDTAYVYVDERWSRRWQGADQRTN